MVMSASTDSLVITQTIRNTLDFLSEMLHDVDEGPAKTQMVDDHCNILVKTIGGLKSDLPDATAALKLTRSNTQIFGAANVERLRQAINRSTDDVSQSSKTQKMHHDTQ